jgi:hypothetical protein
MTMTQRGYKVSKPLTLKLDGEISIGQFRSAVDSFFEMAQNVASEFTAERAEVKWTVGVREGSAVIMLHPRSSTMPPERITELLSVIETGIGALERGDKRRPKFFNDNAMQNAKKLARLANDQLFVSVKAARIERKVSSQVIASVDRHLEPAYQDFGTLEGKLQIVSAADGGLEFKLLDPVFGHRIRCFVEPETEERVLKSFRKRVRVWGLIKYRADGVPVSIRVDDFEIVLPNSELPTIDEIMGILADPVRKK